MFNCTLVRYILNFTKKIIAFKIFDYPHTGKVIINVIEAIVREFKINNKINTISFNNASEAIQKYKNEWKSIDLVILDMIMPEMDGKEVYLYLKGVNPNILSILSSGYSKNKNVQEILDLGANGFIQKPFSRAELLQKIANIL